MTKSSDIKVTLKSTKQDLREALNKALVALREHEKNKFIPEEEKEMKRKKEIIEKVEKINTNETDTMDMLLSKFAALVEEMYEANEKKEEETENLIEEYNKIKQAIEIKEQELKEVFGIEENLMHLATAINLHNEKVKELEEEYNEKVKQQQKTLEAERESIEEEIERKRKEQQKEKEVYEYELRRTRKIENDNWEDEKNQREKDLQEYIDNQEKLVSDKFDELTAREIELKKQEEYIKDLEIQVNNIQSLINEAVGKAVEKTKESCKKSYTFEKTILEKSSDAKIQLLESKVESLTEKLSELQSEKDDLKQRLENAYAEIRGIANKSMETSSNIKYAENLERTIYDLGQNASKKESK